MIDGVEIVVEDVRRLRFDDGSPVRAASAVAAWGDGFLVVQDDATHAAWCRAGATTRVRILPPVQGLDMFDEASGTKHLKPDLEAACRVEVRGREALLAMGSGSSPARMRWVLLPPGPDAGVPRVADMSPLYAVVAGALAVDPDALNLEGACVVGDALRWFHRGLPSAGLPSGSVDLGLAEALAAVAGEAGPDSVPVTGARHHDLGTVDGVGLAVTDAVVLPGGGMLLSAAAEDSPSVRDDGPVVGSALVRLGEDVEDVTRLPLLDGAVCKLEGLAVREAGPTDVGLLGVVDADDPAEPSLAMWLRVRW